MASCAITECGSSKRYRFLCSDDLPTKIPLVVTTGNGQNKSIVYDFTQHKGLDDLLKLAQTKLNAKPKPTCAWTTQGSLITDEMIPCLEANSLVRVGRPKI